MTSSTMLRQMIPFSIDVTWIVVRWCAAMLIDCAFSTNFTSARVVVNGQVRFDKVSDVRLTDEKDRIPSLDDDRRRLA